MRNTDRAREALLEEADKRTAKRRKEICELIREFNLRNQEIIAQANIPPATFKRDLKALFKKYEVDNRMQLTVKLAKPDYYGFDFFTDQEKKVLKLAKTGMEDKEIDISLSLTKQTARKIIAEIRSKTGMPAKHCLGAIRIKRKNKSDELDLPKAPEPSV